jgi:hypothetical protein
MGSYRTSVRNKWIIVAVGLSLASVSVYAIPAAVFSQLVAHDPRLKTAIEIVTDSNCAITGISQSELASGGKDLATLADLWLKLRNAAEQRTDWYYVALIAAFAALMSGYEKLKQAFITGQVLLIVLGVGGIFAGFWIGHAVLYDVGRLNLVGQILDCSAFSKGLGLKDGQYLMDTGFACGALSAGIVFFYLMLLLSYQLGPDSVVWQWWNRLYKKIGPDPH